MLCVLQRLLAKQKRREERDHRGGSAKKTLHLPAAAKIALTVLRQDANSTFLASLDRIEAVLEGRGT